MKAIDFYKFIHKNECEYHWHGKDVYLFISMADIPEFNKLLGSTIMDENGIDCTMKDDYFCFTCDNILGFFGIELTEIFEEGKDWDNN